MRTRRTKNQIEKDNYNKDVDAYNFYVVNLDTKRAETGFEYREDAVDLLNDYDDKKKYKVVSKRALKMMGIENPNESFKYETGGDFQAGVYAKGGSLEAHGIELGDTFVKTISGNIQKIKDKNGKIVYINLATGERDTQPPLPFEMGGYTDLSKSKPEVINERKPSKYDVQIPEIDIEKIKTVYLDIPNNKIRSLDDSIRILKQIYDKGSINAYEEVKILFLDNSNQVIGIYNHSKGGITGTVIDVEMVCALAVKCLAKGVIMSHNHPSGNLKFSDADIKTTRALKNALNLFNISLLDSIVMTENGFTSMTNEGILANGGSLSKFENGGNFEKSFNVFYTTKSGRLMVASKVMAKTENEAKEKIVKQMRSSSTFDKVVTVSNSYENGGGIGMEEDIDMSDDNRLRVGKPAMPNKKLSNLELAEKHNALAYEFMEEKKAFGGSLFSRAKIMQKPIKYPNLEDKNVTLKNGKMVKVFSQSGSTLSVIEFGKIGSGVQLTKIDISEIEPSSYKMGGALVGNQKRIDMNKNGKIDAEDFKLLRSSMNGAWRNDHKHVNHDEDYEVRYARPRPNRKGYKGVRKFGEGGGISNFERLSRVVAKNYEGNRVKPQYQKDYGKVYNKSEAKEVGNRVAGKMKMMKK